MNEQPPGCGKHMLDRLGIILNQQPPGCGELIQALDVQPQVQNLCLLILLMAGSSRELSKPVFQDPSFVCAPFWKERLCRQRLWIRSVIRAKAVSEKEVDSGNDIYGNPIKRIQYEIKQIKMFKGPDKDIEFIYTAPSSAVCGVTLDVGGKKEYLIAGKAEGDGKMHITLCDFIVPWDTLSTTQKKSLNHRYQMGCECKITRCPMIPCYISSPDECLWMDWVTEKSINGHQAKFFACIKRSDGSCAWYRGAAPPKQELLDIEDP
ncbi:Metalloproteinase inhibitor 2 [Microtus ochrogaster]|uniref:Metalloproteinase inhibitor 2 n=1 Tax=Microtus ochrogaster TaxID=79684 RepID=A0A8J6KXN1_MICOH|nr:Metalloproteinase inhibitor 2 [Microtus ochrogaster]